MTVKAAIFKQLDATWAELRAACEQIPEEHWNTGDIDCLIPARHVLHAISAAEVDLSDTQPKTGEQWGERSAAYWGRPLDWEGADASDLPSRTEMCEYLDHVRAEINAWLDSKSEDDLLAEQTIFTWTGPNLLSRCIYIIRHNQGHVQEINVELRRRGLPRIKWEC